MTITPEQVEQNKTKFDVVDKVCLEIDSNLGDPVYADEMMYGGVDDPHWVIKVEGQATQEQLDTIMEMYLAAGWGRVYAVDCVDRKRNMINVTIHKFKERIIHL